MRMPDATHVQNHAIAIRSRTSDKRLSSLSSDAPSSEILKGLFTMKVTRRAKATAMTSTVKTEGLERPSLPAKSGPDELQHEFIDRHLGTKYDRVARILGMTEEISFRREPEARRLDFPPQCRLFNAMQGFHDAYTRARLSRMVGNHQHTARFEGLEQPAIHLRAVDAHERRVVIGKKEGDQIEIARARWNWIVVVSQNAYDVPHRRRFRTLVEALLRSRRNRLRVLRIHRSARTHRAGEQLGRIASARAHVEHPHAQPHAGEREQQLRISSLIGLTVGIGSVRARHDGAVIDVFVLAHGGASRERRCTGKNDRPNKQFSVHVRLSAAPSATLELRFALLVEGAKAFPAVFGSDEPVVGLDFESHRRREIHLQAVADRVLRLPHGERSERSDALSRRQRLPYQLAGLAEPVHETPGVCFLRGKWAGRQNELLGASLADDAGQRLRAAAARHDPERHFRKRKPRGLRRVGKIAM